jgi:aminocarboxymuconate-semialdehyde decarboxylase
MIFDADSHFLPKFAYDRMTGEYAHLRPRLITDGVGTTLYFQGEVHPNVSDAFDERTWSVERRLEEMDHLGIDRQVLFPNHTGLYDSLEPRAAAALCRNYNDGMAEVEQKYSRFLGTALLPMQDVDEAIRELHRVVEELGMRAVAICPNTDGRNLDRLDLWDFYAEVERLGVALLVHGDTSSKLLGWERMRKHRLLNCFGFPFDYMVVIACLIFSGVLDRYPRLRICFAEGGISYLPFLADRLQETSDTFKSPAAWNNFSSRNRPANKRSPLEYLPRLHHVISPDEALLSHVIEAFGDDNLMVGSDYPHPDSHTDAFETVRRLPSISGETKEKILWSNAAQFFGVQ